MNPFSKQLNAVGIKDEQKPEGGRGDWQTVRTSYSFEVAVSSREQCFMEMSLVSFAAVPVYWCLCRGTVDRLLVSGQTDVNLSSEDELPFKEQQISSKVRNVDTFIQMDLLSCKKVRWRPQACLLTRGTPAMGNSSVCLNHHTVAEVTRIHKIIWRWCSSSAPATTKNVSLLVLVFERLCRIWSWEARSLSQIKQTQTARIQSSESET